MDTVGPVNQADAPIWWAYPVDLSSWTAGFSPTWPYYPGYTGTYTTNPMTNPRGSVQITSDYTDTFSFGNFAQNQQLVSDAANAYSGATGGGQGVNGALREAGFVGVGEGEGGDAMSQGYGMWWAYLTNDVQQWTFTPGGSCSGWPLIGNLYTCQTGVAQYIDQNTQTKKTGAGVAGVYGNSYQDLTGTSTGNTACQANVAQWGSNPPTESYTFLPSLANVCTRNSDNGKQNLYGLLFDTTPGGVVWNPTPFQSWQDDVIPVAGTG